MIKHDTRQLASDTKFYESYSRFLEQENRYETWRESVDRVCNMHRKKYENIWSEELENLLQYVQNLYYDKLILGAQRTLQFGGDQILKHNFKLYNCVSGHLDRVKFFSEYMYLLLCGSGVGFSIQKQHISKLPKIHQRSNRAVQFTIEDSIEGWADVIQVLMESFFEDSTNESKYFGKKVYFDFSKIRPKGSLISGGFKAPGPEPLRKCVAICEEILTRISYNTGVIKTIEAYDIAMHIADAVISGGVRRAATIALFSHDDKDMLSAKTGNWFIDNPQRARSNNSVLLLRDDATLDKLNEITEYIKQFGEPGFILTDNLEHTYNPCVTKDMLISTDNGLKSVEELIDKPFNAIRNGMPYQSKKGFWKTGVKMVYELITKCGFKLKATANHEILTPTGYTPLEQLQVGSFVAINEDFYERKNPASDNDKFSEITSIIELGVEDVYDCTVEEVHSFECNGIIVHNCVEIGMLPVTEEGESGFQACVSYDTKLITKDGIVKIGEAAEVGKEISIWNGQKWSKVTPMQTGVNRELYRVQFSDGSILDCTDNHKFLIKNRFEKEYRELSLLEVMEELKSTKYAISVPRANITEYDNIVKNEYAYEYGYVLGDGTCKNYKSGALRVPFTSIYETDLMFNEHETAFKDHTYGSKNLTRSDNGTKYVNVSFPKIDIEFSKKLKYSHGLPDELFTWDRQTILDFFAGWIDSDGTVTKTNTLRIYGREDKIRDAQLLLTKNGIHSSVNLMQKMGVRSNMTERKSDVWYLQITEFNGLYSKKYKNIVSRAYKCKGKNNVIKNITKLDFLHNTYCFNEPELHTGLFNNVITKQCNLTEINGSMCDTKEIFFEACKAGAIMGTIQAGYTDFKYVSEATRRIVEREALLGVSITGWMNNPEVLFDEETLKKGAEIVKETNKKVAKLLGINQAARCCTVKPSGNACTSFDTKIKTVNGNMSLSDIFNFCTESEVDFDKISENTWITPTKQLKVYDENNDEKLITNLYVNGVSEVFEIEFEDNTKFLFTGNHKLKTTNGWKYVNDLTDSDEIISF